MPISGPGSPTSFDPALELSMSWKPGDRLRHRFNPDLGPGLVRAVEGRTLVVHFPVTGESLRIAAGSDAILPLEFSVGSRGLLHGSGATVCVESVLRPGRVRLADGREVDETDLWPLPIDESPAERLAVGEVDSLEQLSLRLDALHLAAVREADGLGSFLGGRIRLFPHQLHVAEAATRTDPVRWLLADEVGLGKTVEACLVLNHLVRTGRAERTLVVAPETLTVQWLGELWRKYHQVFVLLDEKRLVDVEKVYGPGFNPFEAHDQIVVGAEFLRERRRLTEQAVEAGIDLLIVDEAHHLRRPRGHPGNPDYRAVAPIAACGRHVLLLTATPLDEDAHGFFRLLQLLRPDEFPEDAELETRVASGEPLPPCTSATRRVDIGGLPPRRPAPVDLDDDWGALSKLESAMRERPAANPVARRRKARSIRRALASGAALEALLDAKDDAGLALARKAARADPRLAWLAREAPAWRTAGDKTLVFVAHRETLELVRATMSRRAQIRVGVFHEDLSPGQRDIEVAQFRLPGGPSILVSTECGGEGRNFEFCTRIVLFDMPWNPMVVEQRIGRLDRIGRTHPVEIRYPRPPSGVGARVIELYEALGVFRQPLGGIERELAGVESVIETLALTEGELPDASVFRKIVAEAERAQDRIHEAAHHELHRNPYRPEKAGEILSRVPEQLDELTRDVILAAADLLGLHVEEHRDGARHSIELGTAARLPSLPGVPAGSSFLGTFDREEAVRDESIDFFASGHPLVEGILAWLDESTDGRVGLLHASGRGEEGFGLLAVYQREAGFEAVAVDASGREHPDWARMLTTRPLRSRRIKPGAWASRPGWPELMRSMAKHLEPRGRPALLAAFRLD
jgi:ATP-dependent helicase HepA